MFSNPITGQNFNKRVDPVYHNICLCVETHKKTQINGEFLCSPVHLTNSHK